MIVTRLFTVRFKPALDGDKDFSEWTVPADNAAEAVSIVEDENAEFAASIKKQYELLSVFPVSSPAWVHIPEPQSPFIDKKKPEALAALSPIAEMPKDA